MAPSGRLARQCTTHLHPRNAVAEFPRQGHTAAGVVEQHGDVQGDGRCGGVDGVLVVDCALQLAQCLDSGLLLRVQEAREGGGQVDVAGRVGVLEFVPLCVREQVRGQRERARFIR